MTQLHHCYEHELQIIILRDILSVLKENFVMSSEIEALRMGINGT